MAYWSAVLLATAVEVNARRSSLDAKLGMDRHEQTGAERARLVPCFVRCSAILVNLVPDMLRQEIAPRDDRTSKVAFLHPKTSPAPHR